MVLLLRHFFSVLALCCVGLGASAATGQTINWSSLTNSLIVDNTGSPLDPTPESYLFTLGAFDAGFDPLASNTDEWGTRWHELDRANYSYTPDDLGYFTSTVSVQSIPEASYVSLFEGKTAYIWIYNEAQTEQFLSTAGSFWTLPDYDPTCCSNGEIITWSLSDFKMLAPVVGSQNGVDGGGEIASPGTYDLQTAVVPEPGPLALFLFVTVAGIRRRRRIQ